MKILAKMSTIRFHSPFQMYWLSVYNTQGRFSAICNRNCTFSLGTSVNIHILSEYAIFIFWGQQQQQH